jgi:alanyl-tRNA synthetase
LREKLAAVRKAFDKQIKEKEAAANKEAVEKMTEYFKSDPKSEAFFAVLDVGGNAKVMLHFMAIYLASSHFNADPPKHCATRQEAE